MNSEHRRKQLIGAGGTAVALVVILFVWWIAPVLFRSIPLPAANNTADRLAFAARWCIAPALSLLVGIWAAARRGFYADAIDGTRLPANAALEINLRYNTNTVEQVVLAVLAYGALAVTLPHEMLFVLPMMAMLFVVGRATFWIGYLIVPVGRAFGMVLTIVPTIAAYGWLIYRALTA